MILKLTSDNKLVNPIFKAVLKDGENPTSLAAGTGAEFQV